MTKAPAMIDDDGRVRRTDLDTLILKISALLARVSAGEITATPGFEQRVFGGLVVLEAVASGRTVTVRDLVERWADLQPPARP